MTFLDRLNGTIAYIEENLTKEVCVDRIAAIAATSEFQFQRTFSLITGISLTEYIRRRRLTLAAFELQASESRILDIALKYGYESHEAFTRAFRNMHGIPPSLARRRGESLKVYPRLTFSFTIKGEEEMDYRIEKKESFKMFGIEKLISSEEGEGPKEIPLFWDESFGNGSFDKLYEASVKETEAGDLSLLPIYGMMCYEKTEGTSFPYMIGAILSDGASSEGYKVVDVREQEWAIFRTKPYTKEEMGEKITGLWKRIYTEWFPTSGFVSDEGCPEIEAYYMDIDKKELCEVWIPVCKKS